MILAWPLLTGVLAAVAFREGAEGVFAWVALSPLAALLLSGYRRPFFAGWLAGLVFSLVVYFWLTTVTYVGWILVALYVSLWWGAWSWWNGRALPFLGLWAGWLLLTGTWVALECARGFLFSGFAWGFLGYTQAGFLPLLQTADLAGVWGVSALLAAANAALALLLVRGRRAWGPAALTALLAAIAWGYGEWRLAQPMGERQGPVAVVQGNIPQDLKNLMTLEAVKQIFNVHMEMTEEAAKRRPPPRVILWPETMVPGFYRDGEFCFDLRLAEFARTRRQELLVGVAYWKSSDDGRRLLQYNSAIRIDAEGKERERYSKRHLVPGGEYVPLGKLFPILNGGIATITGLRLPPDLSPGEEPLVMNLSGWPVGVPICYEVIFPEISREFVNRGARLLINMTNEGWFKESDEFEQILPPARFRAVENRVGMLRAANTGISCSITPHGAIHAALEKDGRRKNFSGLLVTDVFLGDGRLTLYRLLGDWLAWTLWGVALFLTWRVTKAVEPAAPGSRG